jgi:hypothetical protein
MISRPTVENANGCFIAEEELGTNAVGGGSMNFKGKEICFMAVEELEASAEDDSSMHCLLGERRPFGEVVDIGTMAG